MKTGFNNELVPENKTFKNPWDFTAPAYDQRSSCFINAGTHHGLGKKQPVGTEKESGSHAIPMGRVNTLKIDNVPYERLEEQ